MTTPTTLSYSQQMLDAARTAYQSALAARVIEVRDSGSRRVETHDIEQLRQQVVYWERVVMLESRLTVVSIPTIRHQTASFADE